MPGARAAQNLQMPHPQDWKGGQMPRGSPGGGGGLFAARIDWCITHRYNIIKSKFSIMLKRNFVKSENQLAV